LSDSLENLSAEELARRVQGGSSDAFEALVDRFAGRLQRYLRQRVGRDHDAEDLAQETLLRAYAAIGRYQPERSFATWLFTIATRLAISHLRGHGSPAAGPAAGPELLTDSRSPSPAQACADRERDGQIWAEARRRLSDDQFAALWLHYVEGLSVREAAAAMDKTQVHVKVLLHRGRRRLLDSRLARWSEQPALPRSPRPTRPGGEPCSAD
jgi:RNA polymerase sigma factor (sigma-70 family)